MPILTEYCTVSFQMRPVPTTMFFDAVVFNRGSAEPMVSCAAPRLCPWCRTKNGEKNIQK